MGLKIAAAIAGVLLIFILNPFVKQADTIRFFLLSISFHMLVAYAPFLHRDTLQGFWQFNKILFLRFLSGLLYSVVLGLGISAAIAAIEYLFNAKFDFDTYQILWTCIAGLFSVMFFLGGVPANTASLNQDYSYPKGLKAFAQYVLIPLVAIYLLILLMYEGKILVEWNLPKGNVSYLVLGYSILGILALLLVYPVRNETDNKWLKSFTRSFYFLLMPLLVLLWVAVGARVFKYGITEFRYFLILLAVWLFFISIYFLLTKKQNIKVIPISLSIVALLASYGPQSAFSVAEVSQRNELINIFKRYKAFEGGKIKPIKKITAKDGSRAVAIMQYLIDKHDLNSLQSYVKANLDSVSDSLSVVKYGKGRSNYLERHELRYAKLEWLQKQTGLSNYSPYGLTTIINEEQITFTPKENIVAVKGYDYEVRPNDADTTQCIYDGIKFKTVAPFYTDSVKNQKLYINNKPIVFSAIEIATSLLHSYKGNEVKAKDITESTIRTVSTDSFNFTKIVDGFSVTFAVRNITFICTDSKVNQVTTLQGVYLVKKLK